MILLKDILSNTFVKAAAFILFVILSVTTVFSTAAAVITLGYEPEEQKSVRDNPFIQEIAVSFNYTGKLMNYFEGRLAEEGINVYGDEEFIPSDITPSDPSDNTMDSSKTNFYAEIIDQEGHIIMRSDDTITDFSAYTPIVYIDWDTRYDSASIDDYLKKKNSAAGAKTETQDNTDKTASSGQLSAFKYNYAQSSIHLLGPSQNPKYRVILCLNTKLTADDTLKHAYELWNGLYSFRKAYLPAAIVCFLLSAGLFVFHVYKRQTSRTLFGMSI